MPPDAVGFDAGAELVEDELGAGCCGRTGERLAIADPGRGGRFRDAAIVAFFCAIIVSRKLGLLLPIVLLDRPRPGFARTLSTSLLGALGLLGSLSRSF